MKKIFIYSLPLIAIAILFGCSGNKADDDSFVVKGKLTNTKKDSIYLEELTSKKMTGIDSAVVSEDGEFYFKVKPKDIGFYILKLKKNNFITLLIDKGETVEISADAMQLSKTYSVSGSKGTELIKELDNNLQHNYAKVDSLSKIYNEKKGSPDILKIKASVDSTYKKIYFDEKNFRKKFIDRNSNSLACIIALYRQFGREPMFNINVKEDFAYIEKIDKALFTTYPDNEQVKDLHERVAKIKRLEAERKIAEGKLGIGAEAPDFSLRTPDENYITVSSYKGKILLIDFWASWCAPCRAENPKMVKLYNKFKSKDFSILGVSLDREKDPWVKAIKADKLSWAQVSDLKYWDSPVAKLYNVKSIPYTVLLDKEGKIIAKGLSSDSLAAKITEMVK